MRSAMRLGLSVRETPQAVSVVTRQQMDDQNLQTVEEVLQNAAGVAINRYDSDRTSFFARGFSIASYQYDGIPTTVDNAYNVGDSTLDMTAYDRVEIVRGATGLLTGAGEPSATINLVRKRASSRQLAGNAALSLGSWNNARASADLSTPLSSGWQGAWPRRGQLPGQRIVCEPVSRQESHGLRHRGSGPGARQRADRRL